LSEKNQKLSSKRHQKMFRLIEGDELDVFIKRHDKRRKRFLSEGLSRDESYDLAEALWDRDLFPELDDRRVCFECDYYIESKALCGGITDRNGRPTQQMRFSLQRCSKFKLKGKK